MSTILSAVVTARFHIAGYIFPIVFRHMHSVFTPRAFRNVLQYVVRVEPARINSTKPNLRQVMWLSHCGKPVSECDGSDCWLMECGYITCVGECVHGGSNGHLHNPPPPSSQWLSTSTTSPNTRPFVPRGVCTRDGTKRPGFCRHETHC